MTEESEYIIVGLKISPDSAYHESVGTASLSELLSPLGIEIEFEVCDDCDLRMDEDEQREAAADRREAMHYG